ncbi:hypothetical protein [Cohnella abietis]|uniref:Lipoprotein n=1 Tax=Cohnella abietis TaxID=2507935 RepID=A0A3T1D8C5_9BACL|nr:hypothetical protein [Cohnella abietis]BBI34324.1 hypothetical protein KCTCHS21_37230 [Cohnella abietis]
MGNSLNKQEILITNAGKIARVLFFVLLFLGIVSCSNQSPSVEALKDEDFSFKYYSVEINDNVNVDWIRLLLGSGENFEDNHNGFISGDSNSRRWQVEYPNSEDIKLRLVYLTNIKETYLVFADLYTLETHRGIKAGDSYESVINKYGEPHSRSKPYEGVEALRYTYGDKFIDFVINNESKDVKYISIDYNSYRADKEQKFDGE